MAFESLYVGTSGLRTAQTALDIIGHNIANVNTEGYTRQRADVVDNIPLNIYPGQRGTGVHVDQIKRMTDDFTRLQLKIENQSLGKYSVQSNILNEVQQVLNESNTDGLGSALTDFFNSFQTLANAPEDLSTRNTVLQKAESLVTKFQSISKQLRDIKTQSDELVENKVDEINQITSKIALLNKSISAAEATEGQNANDLRDSRELLEKQLNKILNITSYEDSNHNLFIESQGTVLVAGVHSMALGTSLDENEFRIPVNPTNNQPLITTNGELKGIMDTRGGFLNDTINAIDGIAAQLIESVNSQHAKGSPLNGVDSITGNVDILNPAAILDVSGLDITPVNGTLYLSVQNTSLGTYQEHAIAIDPTADSVNDVITSINNAFGGALTASITADNKFLLTPASGYKLYLNEGSTSNSDTSDFLLATGTNTFFTGNSASSIDINDTIKNDLTMIAAGRSLSPGDNSNALSLADLGNQLLMDSNQNTYNDSYASIVSGAGNQALTASQNSDNQDSIVKLLEQRLASTTGVSLDEEASNMLIYQRMYQASAKYIQVMDSVMATLIGLGG